MKLWMVDSVSADYAGVYSWSAARQAEHYGRYNTSILRPFSTPGSVGYRIDPAVTLDDYLVDHAVVPAELGS